ncbi:metal-dependent hydrolase [Natrarchaeobaculum aegyptiacum]|uniref:Metal-dependent hydrolase n=1 Tax=Natrarchaeobaculum aegyptiacum TaxID=745377 RepID=A0A2Z2I2L3_9EURY|nr:metal-dependent hydrolase [Natrarchaeobaculum aegyptiacum]ARS91158.1 metal-dependent hydrolase [Natrarchaeobaculum aegyptiacum]
MYQFGHYGAALLAYAPVGGAVALAGYEQVAVVFGFVCLALSTLPDVDHSLPLIDHRGITHTVFFALFVGAGAAAVTAILANAWGLSPTGLVGYAFVVGTLSIGSHILADAITPMGVRPLWPVSRWHYTLNLTNAANPIANYTLLGVGVGATSLAAVVVVTIA